MERQNLIILTNIGVIIVLLTACWVIWGLTKTIETDGGHCTANPLTYSEHKIKEDSGKIVSCECLEPQMNLQINGLNLTPN